jgi:hypothetical protein
MRGCRRLVAKSLQRKEEDLYRPESVSHVQGNVGVEIVEFVQRKETG